VGGRAGGRTGRMHFSPSSPALGSSARPAAAAAAVPPTVQPPALPSSSLRSSSASSSSSYDAAGVAAVAATRCVSDMIRDLEARAPGLSTETGSTLSSSSSSAVSSSSSLVCDDRLTSRSGSAGSRMAPSGLSLGQQPTLRSMRPVVSMSSLSAGPDCEPRLVVTPSLRRIHERGLHEVARENPARMRRILSNQVMQQQLASLLPMRRKLIVTARAFVAVFRLLALFRGHSITRQLSRIEDQEKRDMADHVNDIVDERKAFHEPPRAEKKGKPDRKDKSSSLHLRSAHFLPRSREEAVIVGSGARHHPRRGSRRD
jgi:hypothetical protein